MKSVRFTILNSFILAGLAFGLAGSAHASQAPITKPKASKSLALSLARGLGNSLWFSATHPGLTAAVLGSLGAYYLYNCRITGRNWTPEISANQNEIDAFDATYTDVSTDRVPFRYWRLKPGSSSELAANWQGTYGNLRRDFPSNKDKNEFVRYTLRKIDDEKIDLKKLQAKLDQCFSQNHLLPRISKKYKPVFDNPVRSLINNYMKEQNCELFHQLSKEQIAYLNKKIEDRKSVV
jgi:hypothetical protein